MKKLVYATVAVSLVILAIPFFHRPESGPKPADGMLPWQVEPLPGGKSRVFGVVLGETSLDEAGARLGDATVAVIAASGEAGSLEAYVEKASFGFISGKVLMTADLPPEQLKAMQQRAVKAEPQESGNRRFTLAAEDRQAAGKAPVRALAFFPDGRLEEQALLERFGRPGERLSAGDTQHFLYADKGLDVALTTKGKAVLQYVAPARFALLREPLLKASATTPTTAPTPVPAPATKQER